MQPPDRLVLRLEFVEAGLFGLRNFDLRVISSEAIIIIIMSCMKEWR